MSALLLSAHPQFPKCFRNCMLLSHSVVWATYLDHLTLFDLIILNNVWWIAEFGFSHTDFSISLSLAPPRMQILSQPCSLTHREHSCRLRRARDHVSGQVKLKFYIDWPLSILRCGRQNMGLNWMGAGIPRFYLFWLYVVPKHFSFTVVVFS
jgi:hypothetical protein